MHDALRTLRKRSASTQAFRRAADEVCGALMRRLRSTLRTRAVGGDRVVFVTVLRAGMAFVPHALKAFPAARLGVAGLRRDEATAEASWYYEHLPKLTKRDTVVILDPMLATGGSAMLTARHVLAKGASKTMIYMVGVLAAPEGMAALATVIPKANIIVAAVDAGLDARKFIVPGLGDFGDRFCGYGHA